METIEKEGEGEVKMQSENDEVITLQDIEEGAMSGEEAGCQRDEEDNQLDSDLSKVAVLFCNLDMYDFVCTGCQRDCPDKQQSDGEQLRNRPRRRYRRRRCGDQICHTP